MRTRYDVLARKENETTTIHRVFYNEIDFMLYEWEMRMKGFTVKTVKNKW